MFRVIFEASPYLRRSIAPKNIRFYASNVSDKPPVNNHADIPIIDFDDHPDHLPIPEYPVKLNEPLEQQKQRLLYQSRKRGMLENDLLLSTFAAKYLKHMDKEETRLYDQLINGVSNDWEIYYWATETKPTPAEYDTAIMEKLKIHVKNEHKEKRLRQPNL